jgi:type III restriction enzyme
VTEFVTAAKAEQGRLDLEGHAGRVVVRPVAITLTERAGSDERPQAGARQSELGWQVQHADHHRAAHRGRGRGAQGFGCQRLGGRQPSSKAAAISRSSAIAFFQTPAELGKRFRVPQLALRHQGELQLFDDPEMLDYPWDLIDVRRRADWRRHGCAERRP